MSGQPTVLFDIDGTLLQTDGAGMLAIDQAFLDLFGIENKASVPLRGRTDYGIFTDLFRENQVSFDRHYREFSKRYQELLPTYLPKANGSLLPYARELVEQLLSADFRLGILTGNARLAAMAKLEHFGVESLFEFGGYGDDWADRNDVARAAVDAAVERLGSDFDLQNCWVIGDTPADVRGARSIRANAIAVLTGGCDCDDFADSKPDLMIESLCELSPEVFQQTGSERVQKQ